jgi:hypothetical protein
VVVFRNPQIEERQPEMGNMGTQFMEQVLRAPVTQAVPNVPLGQTTAGYLVHFLSRTECWLPMAYLPSPQPDLSDFSPVDIGFSFEEDSGPVFSLMMQALHAAFAEHVAFSLSPELAWYLIAHEVAVHIRLHPRRYRAYFTASAAKDMICVRDDSLVYGSTTNQWGRSINLVREPMAAKVPQPTIDLMLPRFSTSSFESDTALLVLFLDIISDYYELTWFSFCGVPAVRVEGTAEDWQAVVQHAEMARSAFKGLTDYFDDLLPVLKEIAGTVGGDEPDPVFWTSIYKLNDESGGPFINGWITAFFAHRLTDKGFKPRKDLCWRRLMNDPDGGSFTTTELPTHLSVVPFVWDYFGTLTHMAFIAGVMGVEYDGFLTPRLGYGVLEEICERPTR